MSDTEKAFFQVGFQHQTDPDAVRSKKKKCTNLSQDTTSFLTSIGSTNHIFALEGCQKFSNPPKKKKRPSATKKPDSRSMKTPKSEKKISSTIRWAHAPSWFPGDPEVTLSRLRGMARALQSTKFERKDIQSSKSIGKTNSTRKRTEDDEIDREQRRTSLSRTCPQLNGLPPPPPPT